MTKTNIKLPPIIPSLIAFQSYVQVDNTLDSIKRLSPANVETHPPHTPFLLLGIIKLTSTRITRGTNMSFTVWHMIAPNGKQVWWQTSNSEHYAYYPKK